MLPILYSLTMKLKSYSLMVIQQNLFEGPLKFTVEVAVNVRWSYKAGVKQM